MKGGKYVRNDEDNFITQSKFIPISFGSTEHNDVLMQKVDLEK